MKRKLLLFLMCLWTLLNLVACSNSNNEITSSKNTHEELQTESVEEQTISNIESNAETSNVVASETAALETNSVIEEDVSSSEEKPFGLVQNTVEVNDSDYEYVIGNYGKGSKHKGAFGFNSISENTKMWNTQMRDDYYEFVFLTENDEYGLPISSIYITNMETWFKYFYEEDITENLDYFTDIILVEKREEETITTPFGDAIIYYAKARTKDGGLECEYELAFLNNQETNITIIYNTREPDSVYEPYDGIYDANLKEILLQMVE